VQEQPEADHHHDLEQARDEEGIDPVESHGATPSLAR
jgi:hypothetical protein